MKPAGFMHRAQGNLLLYLYDRQSHILIWIHFIGILWFNRKHEANSKSVGAIGNFLFGYHPKWCSSNKASNFIQFCSRHSRICLSSVSFMDYFSKVYFDRVGYREIFEGFEYRSYEFSGQIRWRACSCLPFLFYREVIFCPTAQAVRHATWSFSLRFCDSF